MKTKVFIVGSVGIPAKYGGWETLAEQLAKNIDVKKIDLTVFCSSKSYKEKKSSYLNATLKYINISANGISSIFYDLRSIFVSRKKADVFLVLGVSAMIFLPVLKKITNAKFIVNIDGMEWKRQKWNLYAKNFLKISEYFSIKYADLIIADNEEIKKYLTNRYGLIAKLIPYGGDHVSFEPIDGISKYGEKYILTIARIEPENNIELMLDALIDTNLSYPYVFVGNWLHSKYSRVMYDKYSQYPNIHLIGPIYNIKELNDLRSNCSIYLHGHSAGGTNPSLVEAMMSSCEIVTIDNSFNKYTTGGLATYFKNKLELSTLIKLKNKNKFLSKKDSTLRYARKFYMWTPITRLYEELFIKISDK
jgi:glycosyltransferase involved in cell wall biosynthesis